MQAYISIDYNNRKLSGTIVDAIIAALKQSNITPFVFVDHFSFDSSQERERATAEHSTTVSGASDFQIIYQDAHDLTQKLRKVLETM